MPDDFPRSMTEVDEAFIGKILDAKVISYEKAICEAGQTSLTTLFQNIVYEGSSEGKPQSICIKIHAESLQVRNLAKIGKLYTKECYFYSTFRKNCNLTTPEPYAVYREGDEFFMLIMEDINIGGWIAFDSSKNMANYEEILGFVAEFSHHIHAPFANKVLEYPFLSDGAIDEYEMFIKALPQSFYSWKEAFTPSLAFDNEELFGKRGSDGLPENWKEYLVLYEKIIPNPKRFIENLNKVFASRAKTLTHRDLNTGNIRYRINKDGKKEFMFHDFQFVKQGTLGCDFATLFCTVPEKYLYHGQDVVIMQTALDIIQKECEGEFSYTIQMCIDDYCLFSVAFMSLIISLMSSQYAQKEIIPKEKFDYAWNVLYPFGFDWSVKSTMRHDIVGLVEKVIEGTYKY